MSKNPSIPGLTVIEHWGQPTLDSYLDEVQTQLDTYRLEELARENAQAQDLASFLKGLTWITLSVVWLVGFWFLLEPTTPTPSFLAQALIFNFVVFPAVAWFCLGWHEWHKD